MITINNLQYFSITEVSAKLNKPRKFVYNAILRKKVTPVRLDNLFFTANDIERMKGKREGK